MNSSYRQHFSLNQIRSTRELILKTLSVVQAAAQTFDDPLIDQNLESTRTDLEAGLHQPGFYEANSLDPNTEPLQISKLLTALKRLGLEFYELPQEWRTKARDFEVQGGLLELASKSRLAKPHLLPDSEFYFLLNRSGSMVYAPTLALSERLESFESYQEYIQVNLIEPLNLVRASLKQSDVSAEDLFFRMQRAKRVLSRYELVLNDLRMMHYHHINSDEDDIAQAVEGYLSELKQTQLFDSKFEVLASVQSIDGFQQMLIFLQEAKLKGLNLQNIPFEQIERISRLSSLEAKKRAIAPFIPPN